VRYAAATIGTVKSMPLPDRQELLRLTAQRAKETAFFFDFDGVLGPILTDPDAVWPVDGVVDALTDLGGLVAKVAIVSARPAAFLRDRFPDLPDVTLFGLYGLEVQRGTGPVETYPAAAPYEPVMVALADRARAALPEGAMVEYKRLSVALHYRAAPALRERVEAWAAEQAGEHGLKVQAGRMVVELKPPLDRDKGSVIRAETDGLACGWYFGDDLSDRRAFDALSAREAEGTGFTGVRVAVANPETGAELAEAADIRLDGPEQLPAFLTEVLGVLRS
jgi:trehalose 6-phosphate phosphatase